MILSRFDEIFFLKRILSTFQLKYYHIYDNNLSLRTCQKKVSDL